jgi:crotonobetaine/carnitine-CoA ligase
MGPALTDLLLPEVLCRRAADTGADTFFQMIGGGPVTYAEAYTAACAVGNGLVDLGVERGECVVIMADNSDRALFSWLGIILAGGVEVAINTAYRGNALRHVLENSQASVVFIDAALLPRIIEIADTLDHLRTVIVYEGVILHEGADAGPEVPKGWRVVGYDEVLGDPATPPDRPVGPEDLCSIVYTSGTTGPAKGVMMPHGQVSLFARLGVEGARLTAEDVYYSFIPLFHVAGKFIGILGSMMTGGRVVVDTKFSAEDWLPRVRKHGVTVSLVHGPLVEMIFAQPEREDDAQIPVTRIVASPFPAKIAKAFERRFGLRGIETWGMTEVTVPIWQPWDEPLNVGSCGRIRTEYFDIRIVDPATDSELPVGQIGEVVIRPKRPWTMMQGYFRMPDVTLKAWRNLWFHTGDLMYRDEHGYMHFVDRVKERIRRRAENISSYEIESAALLHPAVAEAAAVGVPSEFEGDDDVKLLIITVPGAQVAPEALLGDLATELPHFMVPRYIEFVDVLPRTPTGKVQKASLRDQGVTPATWDRKTAGVSIRDLVDSSEG